MKVVFLTKASPTSYFVVNHLAKGHEYAVITEKGRPLMLLAKKLRNLTKKEGLLKGSYLFFKSLLDLPFILKENKSLDKYLAHRLKEEKFHQPIYKISSINNPSLLGIIKKIKPQIIIVIGTGIIKKDMIDSLRKEASLIVNWHSGITPEYRGVKSEFWCIYNKEPEKVGSTIMELDPGVDSGRIILQKYISLTSEKKHRQYDYKFLRYKNILLAVDLLNELLIKAEKNQVTKLPINLSAGRFFSTPTKKDYLLYYQRLKDYEPNLKNNSAN